MLEYEIHDMVVCTTTDSGSNFLKAQSFWSRKQDSRLKQASVKVMITLILKAVMREVMVVEFQDASLLLDKMMALNSSYQNIKSVPATYLT